MDGTTATLIGTSIGTIGGLAGGLFTAFLGNRQARVQIQVEERRRRDDLRREACNAFANAAHQYRMHWWQLNRTLDRGAADQELFDSSAALWTEVTAAHSRTAIAGPTSVAEAADLLLAQLHAMDDAGTEWFFTVNTGSQHSVDVLRDNLLATRRAVRVGAFASVVRRELNNDESSYADSGAQPQATGGVRSPREHPLTRPDTA
ncbi:hypothetical protein ACFXAW_22220 [Streptomyces sp. NPDC059445]|uniref:hypothetical protein n=1 Tax=Streptomyces sp. NPDC059445 TaxID=3346832 RepID=UPI00368046E3